MGPPFRFVSVALLAALLAMPVHAALVHGDFSSGLYTAPGQFFTVKSPLGPRPRVIDGFDRTVGSVTFLDESGQLFGVICTPNLDVLAGANIDAEISQAILRNWFRDTTFPAFFASTVPGSTILRDEPGEFESQPAWIAVIHLPRDVPPAQQDAATGQMPRGGSWRGVVVFSRGGNTYLLMTESRAFDVSTPDWDDFLPKLAQFYDGMTFRSSPYGQPPVPDAQSRGSPQN